MFEQHAPMSMKRRRYHHGPDLDGFGPLVLLLALSMRLPLPGLVVGMFETEAWPN